MSFFSHFQGQLEDNLWTQTTASTNDLSSRHTVRCFRPLNAATCCFCNQPTLLVNRLIFSRGGNQKNRWTCFTLRSRVKGHERVVIRCGGSGRRSASRVDSGGRESQAAVQDTLHGHVSHYTYNWAALVSPVLSLSLGAIPGRRAEVRGNGSNGCQQASLHSLSHGIKLRFHDTFRF